MLLMVDTAGCAMDEQAEEDGDSKRNEGEAKVQILLNSLALRLPSMQRSFAGKDSVLYTVFTPITRTVET